MAKSIFSFFSKDKDAASSAVHTLTPELIAFLKQLPTALLLADPAGKLVFVNERAATLLQTQPDRLEGASVQSLGLTPQQLQTMAQAPQHGRQVFELKFARKTRRISIGVSPLAQTPLLLITIEALTELDALEADKAFLKAVLAHYPVAVSVHRLDGTCVLWNKAAQELFGPAPQEAEGKAWEALLPPAVVEALQKKESVRKKQKEEGWLLPYTNGQGAEQVLLVNQAPLSGPDGKGRFIITLFEDVTARHSREQELQRSRTLLQAILDNVPLGLYTRDIDGKMTFFNKQSMRVLNEKDANLADKPHAYQNQEQVKFHREREKQILQEGKPYEYPEEIYVDSTGDEKIIHMIKVPLMEAGPKPLVLSIVEDVTKRRQQEKEVQRVNHFLSAIVQNAPIGLYVRQEDGRMLLRNKQCNAIFGNVIEEDFDEQGSLPHETTEQVTQYLNREQQVLLSGKILDIPEEEYATATGERKLLHLVKVPILGATHDERFVITLVEDITQRRQQERDLIETKNSLQSILEHVPVAIYARSIDDKVSFVNHRALEMFPGETEYKEENDFYGHREQAIFHDGKILEFPEEWYTTKNGDRILLHLIKAPVFDKEGKPFMVLTVAEDITNKKEQERALVEAKNFLQAVINQLPVSLSVKNYDGKYILWNKKSEELFGVRAEDVIGRTAYRADLNKDQAEFLREADLRVFESKKEQDIAQELISSATEGIKIMHTVKTPVFNPDGTPNCLLVVSEDITAKTKMEKQIREASDKNTLLVDNAREGVVILEDQKIIYANRAFCQTLGFSEFEEIKDKSFIDFAAEDHRVFLQEKYEAVLDGAPTAAQPIEVRFTKAGGGFVETEFSAVASKYLGRRIVLGFVRDVTGANRTLRLVKTERSNFRAAFEKSITPSLLLTHKGYISVMNEACRVLFGFTEADKNFYRNVYMRPALSLPVRKKLREGLPAHMEYEFDFARAEEKFPGRVTGEGKLPLTLTFVPINKRDTKDSEVEADYVVFVEPKMAQLPPAPPPSASLPPLPPLPARPAAVEERLLLPQGEPYVLCNNQFEIESCNDPFCSLCQLTPEELNGHPLSRLFQADSQEAFTQDLQTLRQDGRLANREYTLLLGSGLETCQVRVSAVKDPDGPYLFVFRSLAFQHQIMRILEERSAHLTALLASTGGIVFSVQLDAQGHLGRIEPHNGSLAVKLGCTPKELVDRTFSSLFFDSTRPGGSPQPVLAAAEKELQTLGQASFRLAVRKKDGGFFEARITVTVLDLPGKDSALVVLQDLTDQLDEVARGSQQALELQSLRQTLPGLYLKMDESGLVTEAYSNLDYLSDQDTASLLLHKSPEVIWGLETAQNVLFSLKEALSINVNTQCHFSWEIAGQTRYYEASITPISGRKEAVLWITDTSSQQAYTSNLQALARLARQEGENLTEQVEQLLGLGKQIFQADIGLVLRFEPGTHGTESVVTYATENDFNIRRHMEFTVDECLANVTDGNPSLLPDLANASCRRCMHTEKKMGALLAAPLEMDGKVEGALCFASHTPRRSFEPGAEEMLSFMARILSLRIELRKRNKKLAEASKSLAKTLEYTQVPACMLDADFQVTHANEAFLQTVGLRADNILGRSFFEELTRSEAVSKQLFKAAQRNASADGFTLKLDILHGNGLYQEVQWQVFNCREEDGSTGGFALLAV